MSRSGKNRRRAAAAVRQKAEYYKRCPLYDPVAFESARRADTAAIEKLDHVQGVFSRVGQYQIIFGIEIVNKIYKGLE